MIQCLAYVDDGTYAQLDKRTATACKRIPMLDTSVPIGVCCVYALRAPHACGVISAAAENEGNSLQRRCN
jgi:hypothetical protein